MIRNRDCDWMHNFKIFHKRRQCHQIPNQIPIPCTIATGNMIAPAMRNPHLSSEKQTKRCVIHAANNANPVITPTKLPTVFPFFEGFL